MTIASKLTTINNALSGIKTAIEAKGVTPSGDITTYATAIDNIPSGGGSWPDMKGISLVSSKRLVLADTTQFTGDITFQEGSLAYDRNYEAYEIVFGRYHPTSDYFDSTALLNLYVYTTKEYDSEVHAEVVKVIFSITDKSGNSLGYKSVLLSSLAGDVKVSFSTVLNSSFNLSIDNGATNLLSYTATGSVDATDITVFRIIYRTQINGWFNKAKLVKARCKQVGEEEEDVYYECYDIANGSYEEYEEREE